MTTAQVMVVGGGPAGVAAAVEAATAGAQVLLVDEAPQAGGQIHRQLPLTFRSTAGDPLARELIQSRALLEELAQAPVTVWSAADVWGVFPERVVAVCQNGRSTRMQAGALRDRGVRPARGLSGMDAAGRGDGGRDDGSGQGPADPAGPPRPRRRDRAPAPDRGGPPRLGGAEVVDIAEAGTRAGLAGLLRRPGLVGRALDALATLRRAGVPF